MLEALIDDPELLAIVRALGLRSAVTAPLSARGRSFGAISLVTAESGRRYDRSDVAFAEEIGRLAGLAIDNALLFRAERQAADRLSLVTRATALLAESLDYETGLRRLAELVTEDLADFCLIDVVTDDGSIRRVAAIHRDPAKHHVALALLARPPDPDGTVPAAIAMRTRAVVRDDVTEASMARMAADPAHLEAIRQIGGRNFVALPLIARDRVLGAITLSSTRRSYLGQDVELFSELAGRAALHLDNARLYAAQSNAATQARRLQTIVDATFTDGTVQDLLLELLRRVVEVLGTDYGGLLLMSEDEPVLRMRAAVGLEEEIQRSVAVPVGKGFAGRIAATREPLVVEDIGSFGVVSGYLRERARSIVGVPLLLGEDVVGVMHTSSATRRTFGRDEIALLQLAAERAAVAIRRAELYERQREIASELQQALIPAALPSIPGLDLAADYAAAGRGIEVGGDFYDLFVTGPRTYGLSVGDVCGRGPEAAAVTGLVRSGIRTLGMFEASPARVLRRVNETMLRSAVERFCTAVHATVEVHEAGARLLVARAGHPPARIVRVGGTVEAVLPGGPLLGVFPDAAFEEDEVGLGPGDTLVLHTDGLVERGSGLRDEGALEAELRSCAGSPAGAVVSRLMSAAGTVGDAGAADDVVVLAVRAVP